MMSIEPEPYHLKVEFLMSSGKIIIVEMKLEFSDPKKKRFPNNCKFSWFAGNKDNPKQEFVLFDNCQKFPHFHVDKKKEYTFFNWESEPQAQSLFLERVKEKFGKPLQVKKIIKIE